MFEIDSTVLLAMGVMFLGSFVQTAIGFGLAIVAAPLLIQISPDYIPASIVIVAFFISLLNALKHRASIEIGGLKSAVIGRIPGSILGGLLLLYVSAKVLSLWLGIIVLLSVALSLLPFRLEPTKNRMAVAGFLSGFMGTSSGIGGPPMAVLLQHQDAHKFRANLSAFFLFSSLMSIIVLYFVGYLGWRHLVLSLPLIPSAWLGYRLALISIRHLKKEWIRIAALLLCLFSGVGAIVQS